MNWVKVNKSTGDCLCQGWTCRMCLGPKGQTTENPRLRSMFTGVLRIDGSLIHIPASRTVLFWEHVCMCASRCVAAILCCPLSEWVISSVSGRAGSALRLLGVSVIGPLKWKRLGEKREKYARFLILMVCISVWPASVCLVSQTRLMTFSWDRKGCRYAKFCDF